MFDSRGTIDPIPVEPDYPLGCVGQPIIPGQIITYPGRSGSSLWMNVGIVLRVDRRNDNFRKREYFRILVLRHSLTWDDKPTGIWRKVSVFNIHNITVINPLTYNGKDSTAMFNKVRELQEQGVI